MLLCLLLLQFQHGFTHGLNRHCERLESSVPNYSWYLQMQARKACLANDTELMAGSNFASLSVGPNKKACTWWNGLSPVGPNKKGCM
jgi:hypothetical protein